MMCGDKACTVTYVQGQCQLDVMQRQEKGCDKLGRDVGEGHAA